MKIAVSAKGNTWDAAVDPRFGRATFFLLIEPETNRVEWIENKQNLQRPQGAGIQAAQTVVEQGASVVLTGNCGPKAFRVLQNAGVKVGVGIRGTVKEAVEQYKAGNIRFADAPNVEGHWE